MSGQSINQSLPYDETKFDKNVNFEDILNTLDNSDIGYFVEVDLTYPDNLKEKTKHFAFAPDNKKYNLDKSITFMKKKQTKYF